MTYTTMEYRPARQERLMKPVLGAVAVMAALATLGLTVVGPAALAGAQPTGDVQVQVYRSAPHATEVAILPGTIQVVGKRAKTKTAQAETPYQPVSYAPRS